MGGIVKWAINLAVFIEEVFKLELDDPEPSSFIKLRLLWSKQPVSLQVC